jgi:hypothetical protein
MAARVVHVRGPADGRAPPSQGAITRAPGHLPLIQVSAHRK